MRKLPIGEGNSGQNHAEEFLLFSGLWTDRGPFSGCSIAGAILLAWGQYGYPQDDADAQGNALALDVTRGRGDNL